MIVTPSRRRAHDSDAGARNEPEIADAAAEFAAHADALDTSLIAHMKVSEAALCFAHHSLIPLFPLLILSCAEHKTISE